MSEYIDLSVNFNRKSLIYEKEANLTERNEYLNEENTVIKNLKALSQKERRRESKNGKKKLNSEVRIIFDLRIRLVMNINCWRIDGYFFLFELKVNHTYSIKILTIIVRQFNFLA